MKLANLRRVPFPLQFTKKLCVKHSTRSHGSKVKLPPLCTEATSEIQLLSPCPHKIPFLPENLEEIVILGFNFGFSSVDTFASCLATFGSVINVF